MKKSILFVVVLAMIVASCKEESSNSPEEVYAEVSFSMTDADFVTLKSAPGEAGNVPECSDLSMDYAVIEIDDVEYKADIYEANGKYVTQPLKVMLGYEDNDVLIVTKFLVYHGDKDDDVDDELVKAAPESGSDYYDLVDPDRALNLEITVKKFEKYEAAIDVLCFEDLYYENFGFTWFRLELMTVKSLCFFGDICTGKLYQYEYPTAEPYLRYGTDVETNVSPYLSQAGYSSANYDLAAVMKVVVSRFDDDWTVVKTFTNENWEFPGEGNCMEVYWGDYDEVAESFKIDLYVLLPEGGSLTYQLIKSWVFTDEQYETVSFPQEGDDGVVDFVIGECAYDEPDYTFLPHMNLPQDAIYMHAVYRNYADPGFYWELSFTTDGSNSIGGGYDFEASGVGAWCGDYNNSLSSGSTTIVKAYCSYNLPEDVDNIGNLTTEKLAMLNWFVNNITSVIPDFDMEAPGATNGPIFQQVVWWITDGVSIPDDNSEADKLRDMLVSITEYIPTPGEWAAILFADPDAVGDDDTRPQILFTVVDP